MKELYSHPWDFTLYEVGNEKIISVVFHQSFVDISRSFKLNEEESNFDFEGLKALSADIRSNYLLYQAREVRII